MIPYINHERQDQGSNKWTRPAGGNLGGHRAIIPEFRNRFMDAHDLPGARRPPQLGADIALKTVGLSAATGVMGVATGFALFIMTWEESFGVLQLLLILAALGLFVSTFDYIRDVIEGNEHQLRASQVVTRLLLVATFELFVLAVDSALTSDWRALSEEIGTPVLGITLANRAGAVPNLIAMIALWVLIGAALGAGLAFAIT